ncbi:MAG TPA: hypothetical protein VMY77_02500 [Chitinophagaceae bacterium]|nr:hypothetical protein [Chitinophagaceae bacterium]
MKKFVILTCYLSLTSTLFGQTYNYFWNKGDSLYAAKDYKNSAIAYSSAVNLSPQDTSLWEHWMVARSWAMASYPDSAFYHLNFISNSNEFANFDNILTTESFASLHTDSRWSNFKNKMLSNYRNAAITYSTRIRRGNWSNTTLDTYNAAAAWALANEPDSAFSYLNRIVNTNYNVFINYPRISSDNALISLHTDSRWKMLIETVKKNWLPQSCTHSQGLRVSHFPMIFTIDPASSLLKSDGKGSYHHREDKISSELVHAYNFLCSGKNTFETSYDKNNLSNRFILIDLSKPVKGSESNSHGLIKDHDASFHIFSKFDATKTPMVIYDFVEIPVGATVESPRTEIDFHINGILHTLQMGPWALGNCNEVYAYKGHINGNGTTMVRITRNTENSYTLIAPNGSKGRLWNSQNMTMPIDMGLFDTGFIIHLEKQ